MTHYDDTMATTDDAGPPQLPREAPAPKPNSAMIFGILNLVFGIGGLLAALGGIAVLLLLDTVFADNEAFQEAMANQPPLWISGIHTAVWVVLGIWLIVSGIKLLKVAPPPEDNEPEDQPDYHPPCPHCDGNMIVIEAFARWQQPRAPPSGILPIRELSP